MSYGEGALIYLARYLKGGPISNKRIYCVENGNVIFNYGREQVTLIALPIQTFISCYSSSHFPEKFLNRNSVSCPDVVAISFLTHSWHFGIISL
ncbi:MAG: transposase [Deltaproteobacteria bacterium]|nr:transposase [Deltaproteobacteria bacterium]